MADRIANDYRIRGESKSGIPVPYFTHSEELVALKFLDIVIQNDPRKFLKTREKEIMINRWKQESPKQSQWFSLQDRFLAEMEMNHHKEPVVCRKPLTQCKDEVEPHTPISHVNCFQPNGFGSVQNLCRVSENHCDCFGESCFHRLIMISLFRGF